MNTSITKLATVSATAAIVALTAALATAPVFAANTTPKRVESTTVRYDDLNLNSTHGVDRLYERLSRAARNVCTDSGDPFWIAATRAVDECVQGTIGQTVARMGNAKLTAEYNGHFPNPAQRLSAAGRRDNSDSRG